MRDDLHRHRSRGSVDPCRGRGAAVAPLVDPGGVVCRSLFAAGTFDAVVDDVPSGTWCCPTRPRPGPTPAHNPVRHSVHNHFIVKSSALTRTRGLVAVLTFRDTMDALHDAARQAMYLLGDLAFAVRLPTGRTIIEKNARHNGRPVLQRWWTALLGLIATDALV